MLWASDIIPTHIKGNLEPERESAVHHALTIWRLGGIKIQEINTNEG